MRVSGHHPHRLLRAVLLAALLCLTPSRPASADSLTHIVQPGENLFRIGLQYGVAWQMIMDANGLTSTDIYVGQELLIPTDGAPASPALTAADPAPASAPLPSAPAPALTANGVYTVQPGDTLFHIASGYGLAWQALAAANGLDDSGLIYAGQTLVIPGGGSTVSLSALAPTPAAAPTSSKRIVVDLSEQHLYAYENGWLVFSFVASTGLPGLDTQPGHYHVQSKIPNAYGGNWNIWMPNWLGIYWAGDLENGIHALPILPGGGRLWDGYLGTPVSYGCVILGIDDAQHLYDWAELGVPVDIQY